jgi:hypothetical protein
MALDFTIWGIPASHQGKGPAVRKWREKVANAARAAIPEEDKVVQVDLSVALIFFHTGEQPADLDNMAKSTLDGMSAIAFGDDGQIAQLTLRRTSLDGLSIEDPTPSLGDALRQAVDEGMDFVYVRLDKAPDHSKLP